MSDKLSGKFVDITGSVNESADLPAMTVVDNTSESGEMVQLLYDGMNTTEDMVRSLYQFKANNINMSDGIYVSQLLLGKSQHLFAIQNPSTKNKFKGRQGQTQ